jgi:hypothetical protein
MKIDWEDKMLFLMGFYVPYSWWLRFIRKEGIRGKISKKRALELCGVDGSKLNIEKEEVLNEYQAKF